MHFRTTEILASLALFSFASTAMFAGTAMAADVIWSETDAGSTLGTAEVVTVDPGDTLVRIEGTIDPQSDGADVYQIEIHESMDFTPAEDFTAFTTGGDAIDSDMEFDAFLALFDENGFGVYANDDRVFDDGNAGLPSGDALSPMTPGVYYIAIYDDNYAALSELSVDGPIFPDSVSPFTAILGPTGPGGGAPLLSIETLDANPSDPSNYTIELVVPEPGAMALSGAALGTVLLVVLGRRRDLFGPS
jgi:hypothetical protein